MFHFTKAVCRKIPQSIVNDGLRKEINERPLDYQLANKQHDLYIEALKEAGVSITTLDTDETLPDCVFVEDTAVIIGNKALISQPGASARRNETFAVEEILQSDKTLQIKKMNGSATLDGGDVLFTGKEIFVGLSSRTNKEGYHMLKDFFVEFPVHQVNVGNDTLHLKSMMSMGGHDTIICGLSQDADRALMQILAKTQFQYEVVRLSDDNAANCVFINDKLICSTCEDYPNSLSSLKELKIEKIYVPGGELAKVDGSLTCCSLLY